MRRWLFLILLGVSLPIFPQLSVMSYNVENFFYPETDSINPDVEYTPSGSRRWSYTRFYNKAEQIARVIANAGHPDVVCLNEVEDVRCLEVLCRKMPHYPYAFVHFDSPDHRGIDVAILYDSTRFELRHAEAYRVNIPDVSTRDVVYVQLNDWHVIACHLPSQLGGARASQYKRDSVKHLIGHVVDSILRIESLAAIIVCGDMNMQPKEDMQPLHNLMLTMAKKGLGTHKYQGQWSFLDQFYVSSSLRDCSTAEIYSPEWLQEEDTRYLGMKPRRTFVGFRYRRNGFSDHLPILLRVNRP